MLRNLGYAALLGGVLMAAPAWAETTGDPFVKQQAIDQWRASKLVGVNVVGADQKTIGAIRDVLIDHDGNAQAVVIGVGGFLGIGSKNVAVPFKTLQWRTEGRTVAETAPTTGAGNATPAPAMKTDPAATEANQGYPDMAMLNMTKEQLQSAPDFHYAPSPATQGNSTPPAQGSTGAMAPAPAPAGGTQK
jgi:sporulation protein YlmC with PRC-barrel domain